MALGLTGLGECSARPFHNDGIFQLVHPLERDSPEIERRVVTVALYELLIVKLDNVLW